MSDNRILVLGAAGFVGRSLIDMLVSTGPADLVLVDRRPIPFTTNGGRRVVADNLAAVDAPDITHCIVLAGQTNVDEALNHPHLAFGANVDIARQTGEWLRANPRTRLIYVSTDEVLGDSCLPLDELAPLKPTQPYAASKAAAEIILHSYRDCYGLDLVTLRSCNLIGAHQRAPKLVPTAVTHLVGGRAVPVFGDGRHRREWLSVDDLCTAILQCMSSEVPPGVLHCSSGVSLSVTEVITLVADALGVPAVWRTVEDRLVHDRAYAMASDLLRGHGWKPESDPHQAIVEAATAMAAACRGGEVLTGEPAGSRP